MKDVDSIIVYPVINDFDQISVTVEANQKMFIFSVFNRVFISMKVSKALKTSASVTLCLNAARLNLIPAYILKRA